MLGAIKERNPSSSAGTSFIARWMISSEHVESEDSTVETQKHELMCMTRYEEEWGWTGIGLGLLEIVGIHGKYPTCINK